MHLRVLGWLALALLVGCGSGGGGNGGSGSGGGSSGGTGNRPPELASIPDQVVVEGKRLTLAPTATDPDGDSVAFSFSGWSTRASRLATAPGNYSITVIASDPHGGTDSAVVAVTVLAETNPNRVCFDPTTHDRASTPFPSDQFTVPDSTMATGRRIALPVPADPFVATDVIAANKLDGFSIYPRCTVPLLGAAPDGASCTPAAAFIVRLHPGCGPTEVIDLDRRIADSTGRRIIAAPARHLQEATRYALVVTDAVTAGGGQAVVRMPAMNALLHAWESGSSPANDFEADCFSVLSALPVDRVASSDAVLAISPFTVRTVSDVPSKMRSAIQTAALTPASLEVAESHVGLETFAAGSVQTIESWQHRASAIVSGATVAFPAGTLSTSGADSDISGTNVLERVATGARITIPADRITALGGVLATSISTLGAAPGEEIALLARKVPLGSGGVGERRPWNWSTRMGRIAFGRCAAPQFTAADGRVPVKPTGPSSLPSPTGSEDLVFCLLIPAGTPPTGGWPVVHFFHGGGAYGFDPSFFNCAATLAGHGWASISFSASGHGGGPRSRVVVQTSAGPVTIGGVGRSRDLDGDQRYGASEGLCLPQRLADAAALLRVIQQFGLETGAGPLAQTAGKTGATGISFGGHTTFCLAAIEPRIGAFAPNVPGWGHLSWGHLRRDGALRALTGQELSRRGLLNAGALVPPSYGFSEDVPLPGSPVPSMLASGAEPIQLALDHLLWTDPDGILVGLAPRVADGSLRGSPAPILVQSHRGDAYAINPIQALAIQAGGLRLRSAGLHLEREPSADAALASLSFDPGLARHILHGVPWNGTNADILGRIAELSREQSARFLVSGGSERWDPDGDGALFAGDVFTVPLTDEEFAAWLADPAIP